MMGMSGGLISDVRKSTFIKSLFPGCNCIKVGTMSVEMSSLYAMTWNRTLGFSACAHYCNQKVASLHQTLYGAIFGGKNELHRYLSPFLFLEISIFRLSIAKLDSKPHP